MIEPRLELGQLKDLHGNQQNIENFITHRRRLISNTTKTCDIIPANEALVSRHRRTQVKLRILMPTRDDLRVSMALLSGRDGQLAGEAEVLELHAPIEDNHAVPHVAEVIHGRSHVELGEDLRHRVHLAAVVVVDDVAHVLLPAAIHYPVVAVEGKLVPKARH